jgi:catechol 2,3-dioxygenase-like lactoylglutathione lyase family enzyme
MSQVLGLVSVVVRDDDEAIGFYVDVLGFNLVEDSPVPEEGKRWVDVRPPGTGYGGALLARAANEEQASESGIHNDLWTAIVRPCLSSSSQILAWDRDDARQNVASS